MRSELPWCAGGGASVVAAAVVFIIIVLSGINYEMIEHANKQTAANQLFIFSVFFSLSICLSLSLCLSLTAPVSPDGRHQGQRQIKRVCCCCC